MPKAVRYDDFVQADVQPCVTFRDRAFRSRTVVFPDGKASMVEKSVVAVSELEHVAFLDRHTDFERIERSA